MCFLSTTFPNAPAHPPPYTFWPVPKADIVLSTFLYFHKVSFKKLLLILQLDQPKIKVIVLVRFMPRQRIQVDDMPSYSLFQV